MNRGNGSTEPEVGSWQCVRTIAKAAHGACLLWQWLRVGGCVLEVRCSSPLFTSHYIINGESAHLAQSFCVRISEKPLAGWDCPLSSWASCLIPDILGADANPFPESFAYAAVLLGRGRFKWLLVTYRDGIFAWFNLLAFIQTTENLGSRCSWWRRPGHPVLRTHWERFIHCHLVLSRSPRTVTFSEDHPLMMHPFPLRVLQMCVQCKD